MTKSEFWRAYVIAVATGGAPGILNDSVAEWAAGSADLALEEHEKRFPGVLEGDSPLMGWKR